MDKPEWCPDDIWASANGISAAWTSTGLEYGCSVAIALAILKAKNDALEQAAIAVGECPNWVPFDDEQVGKTGMLGRQSNRSDLIQAIRNLKHEG